jgi:hypothetical protein
MSAIDPLKLLRALLQSIECRLEAAQGDLRRYENEKIALMAAIGALEELERKKK